MNATCCHICFPTEEKRLSALLMHKPQVYVLKPGTMVLWHNVYLTVVPNREP